MQRKLEFENHSRQCSDGRALDLLQTKHYKIVKKLIAIPENGLPLLTPVPFTRAQHPLKLMQLQSRVDIHKYSFLPRTIIE